MNQRLERERDYGKSWDFYEFKLENFAFLHPFEHPFDPCIHLSLKTLVKLKECHPKPSQSLDFYELKVAESPPSPMEFQPPPGNVVFCCVSKGNRILHKFSGSDRELEALAERCQEKAPNQHSWYSHTVSSRTFSFLMEGDYTYFAIVDPSTGNSETRLFLERLRDSFKASKNGFQDELVPFIGRLMSSLESMSWNQASDKAPTDGSTNSARMLLSGKASRKYDREKLKDRAVDAEDGSEDHSDRGIKIELPHEPVGSLVSLRKSLSLRSRGPQHARKLWWCHVKVVLAIDVILCLVLFGVWFGVCRGFQCLS